jgi:hypothetical protein
MHWRIGNKGEHEAHDDSAVSIEQMIREIRRGKGNDYAKHYEHGDSKRNHALDDWSPTLVERTPV